MAQQNRNKNRSLRIEQLTHRILLDASGFADAVFYGPTPYLSEADIPNGFVPVPDCPECVFEIETFEDGTLDHGLVLSPGQIVSPDFSTGTENLTDSVDGDDGVIDGTGQTNEGGFSFFTFDDAITVTLPSLMQSAGLVWTDGDPVLTNVIFEAFDENGDSLGTIEAGDIANDEFTGQTDEDSFFGVTYGDGITTGVTSFTITNVQQGSGIEIDHIMFANCSECCEIDLELTKSVDAETVRAGDTVTWTIDLTNNENAAHEATGIQVSDLIPSGLRVTSIALANGSFNTTTGIWTLADSLSPGETESLTLTTIVDEGLADGTMLINTAQVLAANEHDFDSTPNNDDGDQSEDDEGSAKVTVQAFVDVEVTKSVDLSLVEAGDVVTWTIDVSNNEENADVAATGVTLADLLPAGVSFVSASPTDGSFDSDTGVWTLAADLAVGEVETLTFVTTVDAGLPGGGTILNTTQLLSVNETDIDSIPNNDDGDQSEDDEDSANITVREVIDLEVTKTVDRTTVLSGDIVSWTIEVTNNPTNANTSATGVRLGDLLPSGLTLVNASVTDGVFNPVDRTWTLTDPLAPGDVEILTITTSVNEGLAGGTTLENIVQVVSADQVDVDSAPGNDDGDQNEDDEDNAGITLSAVIDLEVSKTVSQSVVEAGDEITWTIEVVNNVANASTAATGVQLQDLIPDGLTVTSVSTTDGFFLFPTSTWILGSPLVPGAVETMIVTTVVDDGLLNGTVLENTVQVVAADQVDIDSTPNNDLGEHSEDDESAAAVTVSVVPQLMLSGYSYIDTNNDGIFQSRELPLLGVEVMLTGTDDLGNDVNRTTLTNIDGFYKFDDLNEGTYTVMQTQPVQFVDGKDTVGNLGGNNVVNDKLVVNLTDSGVNYNFGELGLRPEYVNKRLHLTSTPYTSWEFVDVRETSVWYSFDVEHRGYLDIYGQLPPDGVASYNVFDAEMNLITSGAIEAPSAESIPLPEEGQYHIELFGDAVIDELFLDVTEGNVSVEGDTVIAVATAGDDVIELDLGIERHLLLINGLEYVFEADEVRNFHIGGSTGDDNVLVRGTTLNDTGSVIGDRGDLTSSQYDVNTYSIEDTSFIGGGGNDYSQVYGSLGDDRFDSLPSDSTLTTPNSMIHMADFDRVDAYGRGGNDRGFLYGTHGNDVYISRDEYTLLSGVGHVSKTKGFERVDAFGRGGLDSAELHGSDGNDRYISTETYASIATPNRSTITKGFELVAALAVSGGIDDAYLFHLNSVDSFFASGGIGLLERDPRDESIVDFVEVVANANPGQTPNAIIGDVSFVLSGNTSWT